MFTQKNKHMKINKIQSSSFKNVLYVPMWFKIIIL